MAQLIEANGLQFYVRDEGSGTPVILLHGFPDTGDLWRNQVPVLIRNGFRAIVPDMRGRGRSGKPQDVSEYRLSSIVRDVTGILDSLRIERAHVVGHDWGAAVAWLVAALAPDRVDRLVAISVGAPGTGAKPTSRSSRKAGTVCCSCSMGSPKIWSSATIGISSVCSSAARTTRTPT